MHYFGPNQVKQASTNQKQDIQVKDWRNQARKEKKKIWAENQSMKESVRYLRFIEVDFITTSHGRK